MRPYSSPWGISWWMMPLPAVIHWTSPGVMTPLFPCCRRAPLPLQHIGDGFDAAVRMPGKTLEIFRGIIGAKIVQEEKGIELGHLVVAEGPVEMDARPFQRGLALTDFVIFLILSCTSPGRRMFGYAVNPPSIVRLAPVTKAASGPAR